MEFTGKSRIRIEPDGWVWIRTSSGKNIGLGDIDVDVEIIDLREKLAIK